jgi:hypothetical protein
METIKYIAMADPGPVDVPKTAVNFSDLRSVFPSGSILNNRGLTVGQIVTKFLPYLFVVAGLILMFYLIMGGFGLMTSGGDPKKVQSAQGKITSAVVGFFIIFVAYWITQLLQSIFGLSTGVL